MKNSLIKKASKVNLQGKYGTAILGMIIVLAVTYAASTISLGLAFVFVLPIYVGYTRFHLILSQNKMPEIDVLFIGFRERYFDYVLVMLLQKLFIFLWSLLLIVPGIIKGYSYALVPYILQDEDYEVYSTDAITLSREMMNGYKWKLFMLHLSFIGWLILTILTLGLLSLYVEPYLKQSEALFYKDVKMDNISAKIEG